MSVWSADFGPAFRGPAGNPMQEARDHLARVLNSVLPEPWTYHAAWPDVVTYPCVLVLPAPEWVYSASVDGASWRTAWQVVLSTHRSAGGENALTVLEDAVWCVLRALLPARPLAPVEFAAQQGDPDILTATISLDLLYTPDKEQ